MAVLTKHELEELRRTMGQYGIIRDLLDTIEATREMVEEILPCCESDRDEAQREVRILRAEIERLVPGRVLKLQPSDTADEERDDL